MTSYDDRLMSDVLNRYGDIADEIELLSMYRCSNEDDGFPQLTEEDYRKCIEDDIHYIKEHEIREIYESPNNDLKSKFDGFEDFYSWVTDYQNDLTAIRNMPKPDLERAESLKDRISEEKGINKMLLYHFGNLGNMPRWWDNDYRMRIEKTLPAYICGELNEPQNSALKEAFISVRLTHAWHCTLTGSAERLFRFRLTEGVKEWLGRYETVFDLKGFEDLAFYKDGELLYSSCTHEGFDNDYLE